ncbi:MAG: leucine-rich repeat domain-containing protein [Bacillota bacterium]
MPARSGILYFIDYLKFMICRFLYSGRGIMIAAAALTVILVSYIGIQYNSTTGKLVKEWRNTGVFAAAFNVNDVVSQDDFGGIISRLAGTELIIDCDITEPLDIGEAAAVISDCFYLSGKDERLLLEGVDKSSELTYKSLILLIDKFAGTLYNTENPSYKNGSLAINSGNVSLNNMNINGSLYLLQGIGEGDITLSNITVSGSVYVLGGGAGSIVLDNTTVKDAVYVNKSNGKIRVQAKNNSKAPYIELGSGAKLQVDASAGKAFNIVAVTKYVPKNSSLTLEGSFVTVKLSAPNITLNINSGSVPKLDVDEEAANTSISLSQGTVVNEFSTASAVAVSGEGVIKTARINSTGVKLDVKAENVIISEEVKKQEPDTIFDEKGRPREKISAEEAEKRFLDRYGSDIGKSLEEGKAVVVEGFIFFPDDGFAQAISEITKVRRFSGKPELTGFGSPVTVEEAMKITAIDKPDGAAGISSVEGIQYFEELEILVLENSSLSSAAPLGELKKLRKLVLEAKEITDISPLGSLLTLQDLTLKSCSLKDLSPIAGIKGLKRLTLAHMKNIEDLSFMSALSSLEYLDIRFLDANRCSGVEALRNMTSLKKLIIQSVQNWIPHLDYAPALEDLEIYFNHNSDYSFLSRINNLKRLTINNNDFLGRDDWTILTQLSKLQYLNLSGGSWLTHAEKEEIGRVYSELPEAEKSLQSFRSIELQFLDNKKKLLQSSLPGCTIVYGQREELQKPGD